MKKFIIFIICVMAAAFGAWASDLVQQADSAYNKEEYRMAVRLYHQAIVQDGVSPELYYNLGNAYYRINELGRAVLYYRRALNLDPSMSDARENLEFVKTQIIDKPEDDSTYLTNVHENIIAAFSPDTWAWIAFSLFVLLIGSVAVYVFTSHVGLRKVGFFGAFVILAVLIYASVVAYQSSHAYYQSGMAVVTVPTATLRSAPGENSADAGKVIQIHEGTLLQITDSITMPGESASPKWYDVKINNSTRAWINAADVDCI